MSRERIPQLAIVVPCYNEEDVLPETAKRLNDKISSLIAAKKIEEGSKIYFVDDGSSDKTWSMICQLNEANERLKGIKLSRNRGHQNALLAGLMSVECDAAISIDADLQDDINAIDEMVDEYSNGAEIVYGVRSKRVTDSKFKKWSAESYYKFLKTMGVDIVYNHADYRLLSRVALEELRGFSEVNLFLRGIAPLLGFKQSKVYYERSERFAGESKYPLKKMIAFAVEGITSFSDFPLKIITLLGLLASVTAAAMSFWVLGVWTFTNNAVPGWTSTVVPQLFLGGVQLLSLGVIGQYVSKIHLETKKRPHYIIEKVL